MGEFSPESKPAAKGDVLSTLSPEQKSRIDENRQKAMAKLHHKFSSSNGLLVNFGDSWNKALENEFSKSYFYEVSTQFTSVTKVISQIPFHVHVGGLAAKSLFLTTKGVSDWHCPRYDWVTCLNGANSCILKSPPHQYFNISW